MDRSNRGLLAIAVILIALSAVRVMQDSQPAAELLAIPALTADDVSTIRFEGPDGALAISRSQQGWTLTEPQSLAADTRKVDALLSDWAGGFSADLKVSDKADTEQELHYGLDAAHRTLLELTGAAGPLVKIQLGKSIAGGSHYLRVPGATEVYRGRVPGSTRLKADLNLWEDRRLLPDLNSDIVRLEVTGNHGPIVFRRDDAKQAWQAVDQADLTVSNPKVDALARSLANFTARTILRGSEAEKERLDAKMDSPRMTLSVVDKTGQTATVQLGADHKDKGFVYGQLPGDPRLFVLAKSILRNFDKDAAGLGGGS